MEVFVRVTDDPGLILKHAIWDVTYACPLRCSHCYSESGRRPAAAVPTARALTIADQLIAHGIESVVLSGGEPLSNPGALALIERFAGAGVRVNVFTSGWHIGPQQLDTLSRLASAVHVSLDGACARTHECIRGRVGAFGRALTSLHALGSACAKGTARCGVDMTVIRSNFDEVEAVAELAGSVPGISFLNVGAGVPSGLGSGRTFSETELLDPTRLAELRSEDFVRKVRAAAPHLEIEVSDNRGLKMGPEQFAEGSAPMNGVQIEPDGGVRAMFIYEGIVGTLPEDSLAEIWRRARQRWTDPFVTDLLSAARTMPQWAEATRRIDARFGRDTQRIALHTDFSASLPKEGGPTMMYPPAK
jgi:MoaA/NifB/PqqE/SkfB family radical SAM enzyme